VEAMVGATITGTFSAWATALAVSSPPRPAAEACVNKGRRDYANRAVSIRAWRQIAECNRTRYNLSSCRHLSWASVPS
jgi:hypothetical protein